MFSLAAATSAGTSHLATGVPCQDALIVDSLVTATTTDGLMVFVADGAGSAVFAEAGARLAVSLAADFTRSFEHGEDEQFDASFVASLVNHVRAGMAAHADVAAITSRDMACTLLGVIALENRTLAFQIGDGAIVLDDGSGLMLAIPPMSGEYINMTHFVVDDDVMDHLTARVVGPVTRLAVLSDGLQRLALNLTTGDAHAPFFEPFFRVLAASMPDQRDALDGALLRFLESPGVNDRTDDDKTLVLACRHR